MTENEAELARKFVALPSWWWVPGMLVRYSDGKPWYRLTKVDGYGLPPKCNPPDHRRAWPDLTDPATLGCILALVREAHDADVWVTPPQRRLGHRYAPDDWCCWKPQIYPTLNSCIGRGASEAHALYAALEAADG